MEQILKVENISFEYTGAEVLRDVCFSLERGDFLGIIGANGAGKSTLIKIILGILSPAKGKVTLFGKELGADGAHRIGYVPQGAENVNKLFPATVEEVVSANLYGRRASSGKDRRKMVDDALNEVGLDGYAKRLIGKLSGGELRRVFIARALIAKPELLLMDEPTAGVDAANAQMIDDILTKLNREGMTIIMTNHNTPELVRLASKLLIFCEHGNGEFVSKNNLSVEQVNDIFAGRRKHCHA